jgi:hypothetical protein
MLVHDPSTAGPKEPVTPAPPRPRASVRRTSTIDTHRPEGLLGPSCVEARARDLWTTADGAAEVVDAAHLAATLDGPRHYLVTIETAPEVAGLDALLGAVVGPGFRARVDQAVPALRGTGALLYLLLDDLPGATLVAGYSMLHAGVVGKVDVHDEYLDARGDLCAGWALDASMMRIIRETGYNPTPLGPEAVPITDGTDELAFHPAEPLEPFGMRRLRRLDVGAAPEPGTPHPVAVFFRDSHVDADGRETIVHEYSVDLTVDAATRTVVAIEARADVLPWMECPSAVSSAGRLAGHTLADLRPWVRETFVGTSTCTHLNDVLRGIADVDHLIDVIDVVAART